MHCTNCVFVGIVIVAASMLLLSCVICTLAASCSMDFVKFANIFIRFNCKYFPPLPFSFCGKSAKQIRRMPIGVVAAHRNSDIENEYGEFSTEN